MNPRDKNLLEALRSAGEARVSGLDDPVPGTTPVGTGSDPAATTDPTSESGAEASTSPGTTGGGEVQVVPRSPTSSLPGDVAAPPAPSPESLPSGTPRAVPSVLVWATALGLAFVVGLVVGRQTRPALAGEEGGDEAFEAGRLDLDPGDFGGSRRDPIRRGNSSASRGETNTKPATGGERSALFDTTNQYTLVIANYGKTRDDFAWATHDHLLENGVTVFPPVVRKDDILVLAGATTTVADLDELQKRVHGLVGWNGDDDAYADAYVARIDALIKR